MSLRPNWTRKSDGAPIARLQITFSVTIDQLATAAARLLSDVGDEVSHSKITRAGVEQELRDLYAVGGRNALDFGGDELSESTLEEGEALARRLFPEFAVTRARS